MPSLQQWFVFSRPAFTRAVALTLPLWLAAGCGARDVEATDVQELRTEAQPALTQPRLFFLKGRPGKVLSMNVDGSDVRELFVGGNEIPDGIAVDVEAGHVYWTNMGVPEADDGSLMRADLDGRNVTTIVPAGGTFSGKQLALDKLHGQLYWSDREGMRVMRCRLDGSQLETLVTIAQGDAARLEAKNWAVGMALDVPSGMMYWTQKGPANGGQGSIRRAPLALAPGESSIGRTDIEVLFEGLAEPVDLALDLQHQKLYWSDRGDNTINRAEMAIPAGQTAQTRTDRQVVLSGLAQPIGLALDVPHGDLYHADFGGSVGTAKLDGSMAKMLWQNQGFLNGITYVELPAGSPKQ